MPKKKRRNQSQGSPQTTSGNPPARKFKDVIRRKLESAVSVFSTVATITRDAADAFPPLKSVAGVVVSGLEHAKRAKSVKSDAQALLHRATQVQTALDPAALLSSETRQSAMVVRDLCSSDIEESARRLVKTSFGRRFIHLYRNEDAIKSLGRQLDESLQNHLVTSTTQAELHQQEIGNCLQQLANQASEIQTQIDSTAERQRSELQHLINLRILPSSEVEKEIFKPPQTRMVEGPPPASLSDVFQYQKAISLDVLRSVTTSAGPTVSIVLF